MRLSQVATAETSQINKFLFCVLLAYPVIQMIVRTAHSVEFSTVVTKGFSIKISVTLKTWQPFSKEIEKVEKDL